MASESPPAFGALLRAIAAGPGCPEALAERAGLSVRAVSDLERGARRRPYPHTVRQLARALRLSAADRARLRGRRPAAGRRRRPAAADAAPPTNLPAALTSFVGRERELAEVARLLATTRLLTLTGAGGVRQDPPGAGRWPPTLVDAYPDGVWLVELAPLADPALVAAGGRRRAGRARAARPAAR